MSSSRLDLTADPRRWRRSIEPWLLGLVLGAAAGLVVLGVGGRIAMRAIAIASGTPPGFTVGGTLTVILIGLASGIGGGVLFALLSVLIPQRRPARAVLFAVILVLLTLRGLRPIQPLALNWFLPLALAYGAIVEVAFAAWHRRRAAATSGSATA